MKQFHCSVQISIICFYVLVIVVPLASLSCQVMRVVIQRVKSASVHGNDVQHNILGFISTSYFPRRTIPSGFSCQETSFRDLIHFPQLYATVYF